MEHFPILIVLLPLISALIIPLILVTGSAGGPGGIRRNNLCYFVTLAAIGFSFLFSIGLSARVISGGPVHYHFGNWPAPFGIAYVVDHINVFILVIVSFLALMTAVYSRRSVIKELPGKTVYFYAVFLLLVTGLLGMVITGDMFNLYVFMEISSLACYALVAVGHKKAPLAGFNYLIMGTVGACFYLLGVGYLYMATGTLNMADLAQRLPELYQSKVVLVATGFFMVGFTIKMGLFPLYLWLPNAYTYAPSAVSAFIAATMTKVFAYVMFRTTFYVLQPQFSVSDIPFTDILGWCSAGAIIFGSLMAIKQTDLKRLLAYSSVAQIGYIVLGISLANQNGAVGSFLHILNHAFMKGCLFMIAGGFIYQTGKRNIADYGLLQKRMPITVIAFTIVALSMIGIPPLSGFFSKWYLVLGAIDAQQWGFVAVLLLGSLLSVIYFFKIIETIWFTAPKENESGSTIKSELPLSMLIPIIILTLGVLTMGLFSGKIISLILPGLPVGF
jgi:multicomponent Na+:H+ antiporter subunit D